ALYDVDSLVVESADAGTYLIVTDSNILDTYTIAVQTYVPYTDGNDSETDAVNLIVDASAVSDEIGSADDADFYTFTATAGSEYEIITSGVANLFILDPNYDFVAEIYGSDSFTISSAVAGTYLMIAYSNGDTGIYSLEVQAYIEEPNLLFDFRTVNPLGLANAYDGSYLNGWEGTTSLAVGGDGEIIATVVTVLDWAEYGGGFSVIESETDLSGVDYIYFEFTADSTITDPSAYQFHCQPVIIAQISDISYEGAIGDATSTLACTVDVSSMSTATAPVALLFPAGMAPDDTITFSKITYLVEDPAGTEVEAMLQGNGGTTLLNLSVVDF
nr:hypothetical protein [Spirochaetaceae bacterium]